MKLSVAFIGLLIQVIGIMVILVAQAWFWRKAYKEYQSVRRAFLQMSFAIVGMPKEKLRELPKNEFEKIFKAVPLANWLYGNYKTSIIGSTLVLIGIILQRAG